MDTESGISEIQDNMHRLIFEYPMSLIHDTRLLGDLPGFLPVIECVSCSEALNIRSFKDNEIACAYCGKVLTKEELETLTRYVRSGLRLLDDLVGNSGLNKRGKGRLCSILRVLRLGRRGAVPQ